MSGAPRTMALVALLCVPLRPTTALAATAAPRPAFTPAQAYHTGSWPTSVVIADLTGDGRADVAMSTTYYFDDADDFRVFVFAQQADGTLAAPVKLATDGGYGDSMDLAAGDVDGDGRADLALATHGGVDVFLQGSTGLGAASLVPLPGPRQLVIADVDADGKADLVVDGSSGVQVLTGQGHGAWGPPHPVTSFGQTEIEVADVTGDGRLDIVGFTGRVVHVSAQLSDGGFTPPVDMEAVVGYWPVGEGLAAGDLNGDGRVDVALSIGGNSPGANVNVFLQQGDGTLAAPVVLPSYDIPEPLVAGDVNGDGLTDLVAVHGGWNAVGVYTQQSDGTLSGEGLWGVPYASHYDVKGVAVGDVNGDGLADIAVADSNNGLVVLRGAGAVDTTPPDTSITSGPEGVVRSTATAFEIGASEPGTFECSLDASAWAPCTSPVQYTGLSYGNHVFQARAVDASRNADPSPAVREWTVDTPAELEASLADAPDPVHQRSFLTYTVNVRNTGPGTASEVSATLPLPSGLRFSSVVTDRGRCRGRGAPVTVHCRLGPLPPGQSATVTVRARVTAGAGTVLAATATAGASSWDTAPANDTASTSTTVQPPRPAPAPTPVAPSVPASVPPSASGSVPASVPITAQAPPSA